VFWSVENQKILSEEEFQSQIDLKDSAVFKAKIRTFGPKLEKI